MKSSRRQGMARLPVAVSRRCVVLGLAALAGCAAASDVPQIPAGTPYVRLSNGGSLFGGSSATIYQGDVVIYASGDGTGAARQGFAVLRFGAFERMRLAALEEIGRTDGQAEGAVPCMDYGTDAIEVYDGERVVSVEATCPGTGVVGAQIALRRLLEAEVVG